MPTLKQLLETKQELNKKLNESFGDKVVDSHNAIQLAASHVAKGIKNNPYKSGTQQHKDYNWSHKFNNDKPKGFVWLKEAKSASRARGIIASKLKTMEFLRTGGVTKKEEPKVDQAHNELDAEIHKKFGKRPEEVKESKMSELDANIRDHFSSMHDVEIGKSSVHTHTNHDGVRKYMVHGVTFRRTPTGPKLQTYVHHEIGSTEIKPNLPKKFGGDKVEVN